MAQINIYMEADNEYAISLIANDVITGDGEGLTSLTENRMLVGGAGNLPEEKTFEQVKTALNVTDGADGSDGVGITSVTLHATDGLKKTYRITYTDSTIFDYDVFDGADGADGGIIALRTEAAAFSLSATDANKYIRYTGADAINLTVPNTLETLKPVTIEQAGAGQITPVADAGLTLNGDPKTGGQYKLIQLLKIADNLVNVIGGVE